MLAGMNLILQTSNHQGFALRLLSIGLEAVRIVVKCMSLQTCIITLCHKLRLSTHLKPLILIDQNQ